MRAIIVMLLAGVLAAACGGKVVVDANADVEPSQTDADPEETICTAAGGTWESDGCAGNGDACNTTVCLDVFGKGCHCAGDACWDRQQQQCVAPGP